MENKFNENELRILDKQNKLIQDFMLNIIKKHKKTYADEKAIQKRISQNFRLNRLRHSIDNEEMSYTDKSFSENNPFETCNEARREFFEILTQREKKENSPDYSNFRFYGVSRDRFNHGLVLNVEGNSSILYFYVQMLGTNNEGEPVLFNVGKAKITYLTQFYRKIMINLAEIHSDFRGNGLGRILLQFIENFGFDNSIPVISLDSYLDRTSTDDGFEFDKNLYFYTTQGYVEDYDSDVESTKVVPMKKTNLAKFVLDYGFDRPLVKVDKHDDMFKIRTMHYIAGNHPLVTSIESSNHLCTADFHPLTLEPTQKSLDELSILLTQGGLFAGKTF